MGSSLTCLAAECSPELIKIIDSLETMRRAELDLNKSLDAPISDAAEAALKQQLPAFATYADAKQISFSFSIPGIFFEAEFTTMPTGAPQLNNFRLEYNPNPHKIILTSNGQLIPPKKPPALIRRTFGTKPFSLDSSGLRNANWNRHFSEARGEVVYLYLSRPDIKGDDGPLLMIEKMTGKVWFFPPNLNADSLNPINFLRGLRDEASNKWFASNHHGTWSAEPHDSIDSIPTIPQSTDSLSFPN